MKTQREQIFLTFPSASTKYRLLVESIETLCDVIVHTHSKKLLNFFYIEKKAAFLAKAALSTLFIHDKSKNIWRLQVNILQDNTTSLE
jgi:hypothetical protein